MNKEQAIMEIEQQTKAGVKAFQVLSMTDDDVEMYFDKNMKAKYNQLDEDSKAKYLQQLMDDIYDMLEEGDEYGFKKILLDTIQARKQDGTETLM